MGKAYLQPYPDSPHPPPAPSEARGVLLIRFKKKKKKWFGWYYFAQPKPKNKQDFYTKSPAPKSYKRIINTIGLPPCRATYRTNRTFLSYYIYLLFK